MNDPKTLLEQAIRHHQRGELVEAGALYRKVLDSSPDEPRALEYYGILRHQQGEPGSAQELLAKAVSLNPGGPATHFNLGNVLMSLERWGEAARAFERAVELSPGYAKALCNLGFARQRGGDPEGAVEAYRHAIQAQPDFAEAFHGLGNSLAQVGRNEEAVGALERAAALRPDRAEIRDHLGIALRIRGSADAAIAAHRAALGARPDSAEIHLHLAEALEQKGLQREAIASLQKALQLQPDNPEVQLGAGGFFHRAAAYDRAIRHFQEAIRLSPGHVAALNNLGNTLEADLRLEEAAEAYRDALRLQPDHTVVLLNLGNVYAKQGDFDRAVEYFRKALAQRPDYTRAYAALAQIKKFREADEDVRAMERLLQRGNAGETERIELHFALGKAYDEIGAYQDAFNHFAQGNRLKRSRLQFDISAERRRFARIAQLSDEQFFRAFAECGPPSAAPVFVVGMPRSGTTLTEQILARHSQVFGAGELDVMPRLVSALCAKAHAPGYPEALSRITCDDITRLAEGYAARIEGYRGDGRHVVDKLPFNFLYIGLIRLMFPNAPIIHCTRDPVDTCLSCFKQNFVDGMGFSYELTELGDYYRLYAELMAHWHRVLPGHILDVRYEELVRHPEAQARRILEHCGLPWEDACLRPGAGDGFVKTASVAQARQPIYQSSVKAWERYRSQLDPLLAALRGTG